VSFFVVEDAVRKLSLLVLRNAEGLSNHHEIIRNSAPTGLDEGVLLNIVAPPLDQLQKQAENDTETAARLLGTCGAELDAAWVHYRDLDDRAEAEIDARNPFRGERPRRLEHGDVRDPANAGNFDDVEPLDRDPRDPSRPLDPAGPTPTEADAAGPGWPVELEESASRLTSYTSVAEPIRAVLIQLLGNDPFEVVTQVFTGRWEPVLRQGMAVENLHQVYTWVAANVDRGRYAVQSQWNGNAADAAEEWLARYSAAARAFARWSKQAGEHIQSFARAAFHACEAVQGYLNLIIDIVIDAITLGLAGPIVGSARAINAQTLAELRDAIASIALAWSQIGTAIDSIIARAHEFVGIMNNHHAGMSAVTVRGWPPELGGFNREEF
jgi:uncharacterized protein YukE